MNNEFEYSADDVHAAVFAAGADSSVGDGSEFRTVEEYLREVTEPLYIGDGDTDIHEPFEVALARSRAMYERGKTVRQVTVIRGLHDGRTTIYPDTTPPADAVSPVVVHGAGYIATSEAYRSYYLAPKREVLAQTNN